MEPFNQSLFLWLNAPEHPSTSVVALAVFLAEWLIWAVPAVIGIGWLRGNENTRKTMLVATASGMLALLINQIIGLAWSHPRPFTGSYPHPPRSRFVVPKRSLDAVVGRCNQLLDTARLTKARRHLGLAWRTHLLGAHLPGGPFPARHARGCRGGCIQCLADVACRRLVFGAHLPVGHPHPPLAFRQADRAGMGSRVNLWPG